MARLKRTLTASESVMEVERREKVVSRSVEELAMASTMSVACTRAGNDGDADTVLFMAITTWIK